MKIFLISRICIRRKYFWPVFHALVLYILMYFLFITTRFGDEIFEIECTSGDENDGRLDQQHITVEHKSVSELRDMNPMGL